MTIVPNSVSDHTAEASVTPPAEAPEGGWDHYNLIVCLQSDPETCLAAQPCGPPTPAYADQPNNKTCPLVGLQPYTEYTVKVGGSESVCVGGVWVEVTAVAALWQPSWSRCLDVALPAPPATTTHTAGRGCEGRHYQPGEHPRRYSDGDHVRTAVVKLGSSCVCCWGCQCPRPRHQC